MIPLVAVLMDQPADVQKMSSNISHTNLAVFMIIFMFCAIEVVVIKIATAVTDDLEYSSDYEDDIYEEYNNNYRPRTIYGLP